MAYSASPAIPVPGYDGSFTLDQANDAEGRPSKQEFLAELAKRSAASQALPNPLAAALARGPAAMPSAGLPNRAALASALGSPPPAPVVPPAAASPPGAPPGTHYARGPGEPLLLRDDQDAATAGQVPSAGFGLANIARAVGLGGQAPSVPAPMANGTGGPGPQGASGPAEGRSAARGETLAGVPVPPEIANGAQYQLAKQEFRAAHAGLQAEMAKGSYANEDVAKIYAAQMATARKELFDLAKPGEKYTQYTPEQEAALGGTGKHQTNREGQITQIGGSTPPETSRFATPEEVAANRLTGQWQIDKNEKWSQVKEGNKPVLKDMGVDPEGNKIERWVYPPGTGPGAGAASTSPGASSAPGIAGKEDQGPQTAAEIQRIIDDAQDRGISGEPLLKLLPHSVADHARAIHNADEPLPDMQMAGAKPVNQLVSAAVRAAYPGTSAQTFALQYAAKKEFMTGGPNSVAGTITAGNAAIKHLGELSDDSVALKNRSLPRWNAIANTFETETGDERVTNFNNTIGRFGEEATKFYRGIGGSEADVQRDIANLSPNMSPNQLHAAIQKQANLMRDKITAYQDRWHKAVGPSAPDFPIVDEDTKNVLKKLDKRAGNTPIPQGSVAPSQAEASTAPPIPGARKAPDGNWYVPDPSRHGKYLQVQP